MGTPGNLFATWSTASSKSSGPARHQGFALVVAKHLGSRQTPGWSFGIERPQPRFTITATRHPKALKCWQTLLVGVAKVSPVKVDPMNKIFVDLSMSGRSSHQSSATTPPSGVGSSSLRTNLRYFSAPASKSMSTRNAKLEFRSHALCLNPARLGHCATKRLLRSVSKKRTSGTSGPSSRKMGTRRRSPASNSSVLTASTVVAWAARRGKRSDSRHAAKTNAASAA
mmetsp:Transcript_20583/g.58328  ORF Transcript_20583/g.58328 Transcript_20583/m.58328 type:complete len:226 (+) Transcript_20583:889-1566(+)